MTECLQRILNGEESVRLEAQNILFLQSSCYLDSPVQEILDCHRQSDSTLTIIHASDFPG